MSGETLWLVGQYKGGEEPDTQWDFQGIFSTRDKAVDACRNERYFVVPVIVDQEEPDELGTFDGAEWPNT